MSKKIASLCWWAKAHHKTQTSPENAENQPDFCLIKEKIMKNNRLKPPGPSRIPLFISTAPVLDLMPVWIFKLNLNVGLPYNRHFAAKCRVIHSSR